MKNDLTLRDHSALVLYALQGQCIKSAIDDFKMGNITAILTNREPAIASRKV